MEDETVKKILEDQDVYDDSREITFRQMLGDFYSRKMMSIVIFIWAWGISVMAGAIYCAVKFFDNIEMKDQIMYAAIFLACIQFLALTKIFAWQLIHRNGIMREIKRQELRIVELTKMLAEKS